MRLTLFVMIGILAGAGAAYTVDNIHETHFLHRPATNVQPTIISQPDTQPEMLPVVTLPNVEPVKLSESRIEIFTQELSFQVGIDESAPETKCFRVENVGKGRLQWTASATDDKIKMHPVSGILDAGQGQWITVTIDWRGDPQRGLARVLADYDCRRRAGDRLIIDQIVEQDAGVG